jgi:hypothetical protein
MKKSKVATIINVKPWNGQNGTVYYHDLLMENGDRINIGKKSELAINEELEYEIIETKEQAKGEFLKAKTPKKDFPANKGGNSYSKDPITQFYIIAQSCQDRAVKVLTVEAEANEVGVDVAKIEGVTRSLMTQVIKLAGEFNKK